ncbi:MAG: hypothetical protein XD63_0554 [Thermoanaerobacterales bacterium 50_218]|nr:MAG: hypothetical protein XD63_0554 [Thermoanaerobacterales bacterium 50_218]HAA89643.1 hypothetical protein [Peptococcaceae bacterium]
MRVNVHFYADGIDMFVPGAKFGEKVQVDVPSDSTVGDVLKQLGIPVNVFTLVVNGKVTTSEKKCSENDTIYLLEAVNGA